MQQKVAVFRKESFNAAHRLNNPSWDDTTNKAIFGKCNNPNFHGHNYELFVKVVGVPDPQTGYVMDMKVLSDLIQQYVIEKFDHRNLNEDCIEFKNMNPTAENIAIVIYNILRDKINPDLEIQVRLYETERNFVEYPY
jgi:6-pyruvoyltetrahydropterin/6-carboxytetrahydropterin synthase